MKAFFKGRSTNYTGGTRILTQVLEGIDLCVAYKKAQGAERDRVSPALWKGILASFWTQGTDRSEGLIPTDPPKGSVSVAVAGENSPGILVTVASYLGIYGQESGPQK